MRKAFLLKISRLALFLIFLFVGLCHASEEEDAINELLAKSLAVDTSEASINSQTDFLKSKQNQEDADVEAQLKDIERDYLNKIDATATKSKQDDLANSLKNDNGLSRHNAANDIKEFAGKNLASKKKVQQDVSSFLKTTKSSGQQDLGGLLPEDNSIKVENSAFEAQDMGEAVSKLSMIDGMKNNLEKNNDGSVSLFKGENLSCDKINLPGVKNCCDLSGFLLNVIGGECPAHVKEVLAPAVHREGRCRQIGWYCAKRKSKWVGGGCFRDRQTFCCYKSNLARIFQEIAHHQLNISWGSPQHPNCGPLDPKTFSKLNFDDPYAKKLLQGLMGDINNNAHKYINNMNTNAVKSSAEITNKIKDLQDRISDYFKDPE
jgi:hypothetical protein